MGKTSMYYLIARDKKTNDFSVVRVNGKRALPLEEIDIFTTSFKNSNEMKNFFQCEELTYDDADFFVVSQRRYNGDIELKKYEVLYSDSDTVCEVAEASLNGNISKSEKRIDRTLDYFASQVSKRPTLYELLISGKTNVYEKYAKYFSYTNYATLSVIKYRDGGWARTSYPLIRNIEDALAHVDIRYDFLSNKMHRSLLDSELIRVTDSSFDENQLTIFDTIPLEDVEENNNISSIMRTFEGLSRDTFTIDGNGNTIFNRNNFPESDLWDLECLDTFLEEDLRSDINMLLMHRDYLNNSKYPFNTSYIDLVIRDQNVIINYLREHKQFIPQIMEWCSLYKENKALGDVNGREYQKRREQ